MRPGLPPRHRVRAVVQREQEGLRQIDIATVGTRITGSLNVRFHAVHAVAPRLLERRAAYQVFGDDTVVVHDRGITKPELDRLTGFEQRVGIDLIMIAE